jgi:rSAM/selenodomain-associated transferase 1
MAERAPLAPAVAIMAKAPGMSVVKSRLHGSLTADQATELYRCFLLDRADAVLALHEVEGVVAFTPAEAEAHMKALLPAGLQLVPQQGADLGERLSNLLAELLARGHTCAIAIDSDSPTLPMSYVLEAAKTLDDGSCDVVLGPCEDGGYYLIGLCSPQPALFRDIAWSTDSVFRTTVAKARALGLRVHVLPTWFDVDTEADLARLHADICAGHSGALRTATFVRTLCSTPSPPAGPAGERAG